MTLHGGHWDLPISNSPDKKNHPSAIQACPDASVQKFLLLWWAQDISKSCECMPSAKGQESLMVCSMESGKGTSFLYLSGQTCDSQSPKSSFCCGQGMGWDHVKGNSQDKDRERLGAKDCLSTRVSSPMPHVPVFSSWEEILCLFYSSCVVFVTSDHVLTEWNTPRIVTTSQWLRVFLYA